MRRYAVAGILAMVFAIGAAVPVQADGGGSNNVVLATSRIDDAFTPRSAVQVTFAGGDTLTSSNIADATTLGCILCEGNAVAIQVVIATGTPTVFTPSNFASATTAGCTTCVAYAYASQTVIATTGRVSLSSEAQQQITTLRARAATLADTALASGDLAAMNALTAQLDEVGSELKSVVVSQLTPVGITVRRSVDG